MATATKTRTTRKAAPAKAASKPKPAPEPEPEASGKEARKARDAELMDKVVEMREAGAKWEEVAAELDIKPGKAMFLEMQAQVGPKTKIAWKDDDDLAAKVAAARDDELLSWGQIAARTGASVGKIQRLFREAVGDRAFGHRIGKGGRFPSGMERPEKPTKAQKNGAGKATGTTKAPAKKTLSQLKTTEEMAERLNGQTLRVTRNGKETKLGVKTVQEYKGGNITLISKTGQTRTVKLDEIAVVRSNA